MAHFLLWFWPASVGRPQSADKMFVRARGPQNWNPEVFDQTRCSRTLQVELALNNRELVKAEVFDKKSVRANGPIEMKRMKGAFSLNCDVIGTLRPPDSENRHRNRRERASLALNTSPELCVDTGLDIVPTLSMFLWKTPSLQTSWVSIGNSDSWWTFGLRKKLFSPPPSKSPIRRRHPPDPSAPSRESPPLSGIFNKNSTTPPPLPVASDSPFRLPEQKKIKNIRNVRQGMGGVSWRKVFRNRWRARRSLRKQIYYWEEILTGIWHFACYCDVGLEDNSGIARAPPPPNAPLRFQGATDGIFQTVLSELST